MRDASRRVAHPWFALILITLLALALRLYQLGGPPLRGDEAFAVQYWADGSAVLRLAGQEPHPLGTFALFSLWKALFGDGEWVMRLLSVLLSLPGLVALYALGHRLFQRRWAGLLAALLYAVHPFLIWHAQDARNYAIWTATSAVAMLAFVLAVERNNRQRDWLRYALAAVLSAYIFLLEPFIIAAQGCYVFLVRPEHRRRWLLALAGMGVLLLPWFLQVIALAGSGYGGTAGGFDAGALLSLFLPVLALGDTLLADLYSPLWVVLLAGFLFAWIAIFHEQRRVAWLVAFAVLVPVLLLIVLSFKLDIFRPRYLIAVVPYLLLLPVGFMTTRRKWLRFIGGVFLVSLLVLQGWALINYYTVDAYEKAPDWRTVGVFLAEHTQPGDLVVQQALDPAFTYYFRGPADETTLPLRANAPAEETAAILAQATAERRAVWLIPAELPGYDDDRVPLNWLNSHSQRTLTLNLASSQVLEFREWIVQPGEYTPTLAAAFGDVATLLDVQVERLAGELRVTLYWQPQRQTAQPLTGFVHLVGAVPNPQTGTPLWAQDDHALPGEPYTTANWDTDRVWRSVYQLPWPQGAPDTSWTVHLGLYDPDTAERLRVNSEDHLEVPLAAALTGS